MNFKNEGVVRLSRKARRKNGGELFPDAAVNKMYYIEARAEFQATTKTLEFEIINTDIDVVCTILLSILLFRCLFV